MTERRVVLSGGLSVAYPEPESEAASRVARGNRRVDTRPEKALRSALHRRGLRFRKDHRIDTPTLRVRVDIAFTRQRLAVFVDGCFWHSCPVHRTVPRRNAAYWTPKLDANRRRDARVNRALLDAGWLVLRVWEHEDPHGVAKEVESVIGRRRDAFQIRSYDARLPGAST